MRSSLLLLTFICLLLVRCAREVIIDLPEEPTRLVAVCHFTEGENFRAKISLSKSVNDGSATEFLQSLDLVATLSADGQFWDRLIPDTTVTAEITYWESNRDQKAEYGVDYAFSVRVPGYPVIESYSKIPAKVELEPIVIGAGDITISSLGEGLSELRIPLELRLKALPS